MFNIFGRKDYLILGKERQDVHHVTCMSVTRVLMHARPINFWSHPFKSHAIRKASGSIRNNEKNKNAKTGPGLLRGACKNK